MQRFFSLGFLSVLAALGDLDGGFFLEGGGSERGMKGE